MRRRTLLCLALPAAALARPALAWREQAATPDEQQSWALRCAAVPAASGPVVLCPFCGCPVSGAADHGEGRAAP